MKGLGADGLRHEVVDQPASRVGVVGLRLLEIGVGGFVPSGRYVRHGPAARFVITVDQATSFGGIEDPGLVGQLHLDLVAPIGVPVESAKVGPSTTSGMGGVDQQLSLDEVAVRLGPKVREVQTPEYAVPVGIVLLRPENVLAGPFRPLTTVDVLGQPEHLAVQAVCFGVLDEEVRPPAAAHEGFHAHPVRLEARHRLAGTASGDGR